VEKILVTRHILGSEYSPKNLQSVCAIAPGVLGVTGIETMELAQSLVKQVAPRAVICIDALAARDSRRIGTTVQISTSGIQPGSGVGNHRRALTKETLGTEVIAIGVPTVIYAATLARDAFAWLADRDDDAPHEAALADMEKTLLGGEMGEMIVTPREIDAIIQDASGIIASAINRALQPTLSDAEITAMMN
jgi:spore protease